MAKYNCIIKELPEDGQGHAKIYGRIFLQDLSQIPDGWEAKLRGTLLSRDNDLQKLMCNSTNPFIIYKKSACAAKKSSEEQDVTFRYNRALLDGYEGLHSHEFSFVQPESGPEVCTIDFKFSTRLNIDAGPIDGVGVETSYFWKSYSHGMNLAGECPNMECDSRKQVDGESKVYYHDGYGEIYLPDDACKFNCPACGDSSFHISNFVLSCGRALFRYKKRGIASEVKEFILESNGPLEEYKTFDAQTDQPITDYDFVLIMTVAINQSFYYCMACDETIDEVEDEEMLSCGHSYHKSTCSPGSTMGCIVCKSQPIDSVSFLLTVGSS